MFLYLNELEQKIEIIFLKTEIKIVLKTKMQKSPLYFLKLRSLKIKCLICLSAGYCHIRIYRAIGDSD
jgi:hypothetical protein